MSTRVPLRPLRGRRDPRPWLALWCVLMLSATYVAGWAFWSYIHLNLRVTQFPPGEPIRTAKGSSLRVLSMVQSRELASTYDNTYKADEGMTFVAVRYEITRADGENCIFRLAGAGAREYDNSTKAYGRKLSSSCDSAPGVPTEGEVVFDVPLSRADQVIGLIDTTQRDWLVRHDAATPPIVP